MRTISDPLQRAQSMHGEKIAFICEDRTKTFEEFVRRCRKVGPLLEGLGTKLGDRVGLLAANSDLYAELYCGVPAAGRVIVPLNSRWAEPELSYALEDSGTKLLITDQDPGGLAESVDQVISLSEYETQLAQCTPKDFADLNENDLAGLFYTGGTTGQSKGVMLTHRNLIANTMHSQLTMPLSDADTYLLVAPMFHAAGSNSVLQCLALGVPQVVVPAFDPNLCLDLIEEHRCSATLAVPTMVAALVEAQSSNPRDISSFTLICHGASPIATQVLRRAHEEFPDAELLHLYGATETAPLVTGLRHEEKLIGSSRGKSVGHPSLGVSLKIDADRFEKRKEERLRDVHNLCLNPARHAKRALEVLLKQKDATQEDKANALQEMTAADLQAFADGIWQHAHVESLMIGNLTKDEACDVGERIRACLPGAPIPDNSWPETRIARVPQGAHLFSIKAINADETNNVVLYYFQLGESTWRGRAFIILMQSLICLLYTSPSPRDRG